MTDQNPETIIDIAAEDIIESSAEPATPPQRRKFAMWPLVVGVALLSAVGGSWLYRDVLSSYLPSDQIMAMAARVESLEVANSTLNKKVDAVVGFSDEMKSKIEAAQAQGASILALQSESADSISKLKLLQNSLSSVSGGLDSLKKQLLAAGPSNGGNTSAALAVQLDNLQKDVASLKEAKGASPDMSALSQSLADLKAKIAAGAEFDADINRIAIMVPAAEGLDVLQAQAHAGLPNAAGLAVELRNVLPQLAPALVPATAADSSWWGYATSLASGLITIRASGTSDWSFAAAQALAAAEQGDLATAVSTLEKTEGAMPVELQNWHNRAAARLNVEKALAQTTAAIMRQLAAKG
jgi:hypothetical protein